MEPSSEENSDAKYLKPASIEQAIENIDLFSKHKLFTNDVHCIEVASLSINHSTNYDTNFEDRNGYVVVLSRYIEDANQHSRMNELLSEGHDYAVMLYTWRSCSRALPQIRNNEQPNRILIYERTVEILQPYADQLMNFMHFQAKAIEIFCGQIKRLLFMNQNHKGVSISEAYLLTLGKMLNMFAMLDELKNMKASMKNDYSHFKRAVQYLQRVSDSSLLQDGQTLSMFLATQNKIKDNLKEELLKINGFESIFCDIVNTCVFMFDNKMYMVPSEKHLLVKVIGFALYLMDTRQQFEDVEKVISMNKLDSKKRINLSKIDAIFKQCTVVNLFGDMSITPFTYITICPNYDASKWPECNSSKSSPQMSIVQHLPALREEYMRLMCDIQKYAKSSSSNSMIERQADDAEHSEITDLTLKAFKALNKWNLLVLDTFTWKLANLSDPWDNKEIPINAENYAKAVLYNYSNMERTAFVKIIAMIKSIQALLLRNENYFSEAIKQTTYLKLQMFVQKQLREPLRKAIKNKREIIRGIIMAIREACTDRLLDAEEDKNDPMLRGKKASQSDAVFEVSTAKRKVGPSSTQLYLVRTMLESLTSRSEGKHALRCQIDAESLLAISHFHQLTFFWTYLLNFNETLQSCCDLSQLWYREFFLEMTNGQRIQFDIDMSLPWILTKHVLESHDTRLVEYLFFPLYLYNDSACYALNNFERQFLYDEIEAEANLAFDQLVYRLSEQIFIYYKSMAAHLLLNKRFSSDCAHSMNRNIDFPAPNRYCTVIGQRNINLLGRCIDLHELLTQRMNKFLLNSISAAINQFQGRNLTAIIEFEALIACNQLCYDMLINAGLQLDKFESLLSEANSDVVNPFGYTIMHIYSELTCDVIPNYCFNSSTARFVPAKLCMSNEAAERSVETLDVFPYMLWGTTELNEYYRGVFTLYSKFVGQPHINAIVTLLGYGGISILLSELMKLIATLLNGTILNYVTDLMKHMPKICKLHRLDYGSPGMLMFYCAQLKSVIEYPELCTEVFQSFRELGNIIIFYHLIEQYITIREVNDLTHAAPFLNILPRPYVSINKDSKKSIAELRQERDEQMKLAHNNLQNKYAALQFSNIVAKYSTPELMNIKNQCAVLTQERLCCGLSLFEELLSNVQHNLKINAIWQGPEPANGVMNINECTEFHRLWSAIQFSFCIPTEKNTFTVEELFGDGLQWAGCAIITLLKQERRFELLDMSYHLRKMNLIDKKTDMCGRISLKLMVKRINQFEILNNKIFAILNKYLSHRNAMNFDSMEHITCFKSPVHDSLNNSQAD